MNNSHYFINDETLKRDIKYIDYNFNNCNFKFATTPGVFSKDRVDYATDILIKSIPPICQNSTILDMGCGYGCIGIVLAKVYGLCLTQADVNKAAVDLTQINCEYNGVKSALIVSDCFVHIHSKFDTIVINPPIHAGKSVTYKMYDEAASHLSIGGRLYIVILKKHGAESTLTKLREIFDNHVEVIYKKKGIYVFECLTT